MAVASFKGMEAGGDANVSGGEVDAEAEARDGERIGEGKSGLK